MRCRSRPVNPMPERASPSAVNCWWVSMQDVTEVPWCTTRDLTIHEIHTPSPIL